MPTRTLLLISFTLASPFTDECAADDAIPVRVVRIGQISDPQIREASGFVKSRKHRGVYWIVSDSLNPPVLYAISRTGNVLARYRIRAAANVDWETIAIDPAGWLYIGDTGNNISMGRRWFLKVREPDPSTVLNPRVEQSATFDALIAYTFPDKPFDVEGSFFLDGRLFVVSKSGDGAIVYEVPIPDEPANAAVKLVEVAKLDGITVVTGAGIDTERGRLFLCGYDRIATWDRVNNSRALSMLAGRQPTVRSFKAPSIESLCLDGNAVLLLSENGSLYEASLR